MTPLPFELAKKLKDAGWPQPDPYARSSGEWMADERFPVGSAPYVASGAYSPSLSELIAACRDGFDNLHRFEPFQFEEAPRVRWRCNWGETEDRSDTTDPFLSPEEAVANLWLALKEQSVPLPATG